MKEKKSETMETVFILYGKIYIIMNDDNNNKKESVLDLKMKRKNIYQWEME